MNRNEIMAAIGCIHRHRQENLEEANSVFTEVFHKALVDLEEDEKRAQAIYTRDMAALVLEINGGSLSNIVSSMALLAAIGRDEEPPTHRQEPPQNAPQPQPTQQPASEPEAPQKRRGRPPKSLQVEGQDKVRDMTAPNSEPIPERDPADQDPVEPEPVTTTIPTAAAVKPALTAAPPATPVQQTLAIDDGATTDMF